MANSAVRPGHALYFEFHKNDDSQSVAQFLWIAETLLAGSIVPSRLYSREIKPGSPRQIWRPDSIPTPAGQPPTSVNPSGEFTRIARPETAINRALHNYMHIAGVIDATALNNYTMYREPFVVHVGPLDVADLQAEVTPKKLIDRVRKVRDTLGWVPLPTAAARGTASA